MVGRVFAFNDRVKVIITSQRIRHYYYKNSPLLLNEFDITSHRNEISCRDDMLDMIILSFFQKKPYPSRASNALYIRV